MNYRTYCKLGALFTIILGSILHFTYDFFETDFTAIFSAVNESTWEHLKLLFFPVMIFAIIEYFIYGKKYTNFWASKVISLLIGMLAIVVVFYTYTGIIGESSGIFNILLFVASTILTYWLNCMFIENELFKSEILNKIAVILSIIIFVMFWIYTFYPPLINLFRDPVTGGYGI